MDWYLGYLARALQESHDRNFLSKVRKLHFLQLPGQAKNFVW